MITWHKNRVKYKADPWNAERLLDKLGLAGSVTRMAIPGVKYSYQDHPQYPSLEAFDAQYPSLDAVDDLQLEELSRLEYKKLYAAGMSVVQEIFEEMTN